MRLSQGESQWHDFLRLLLLAQVVFGHMAAIALPNIPELSADMAKNWPYIAFRMIWRFGSQSAFLFVFLSGFMVAGPMMADALHGKMQSLREFSSRRLLRIAPVAVVAVFLTAVLDTVAHNVPGAVLFYEKGYAYDMAAAFNWPNFFGNLLFLQPVAVDSFGSNGPLWTLGYIVQYYLLGWLLCRFFQANRWLSFALLACALGTMWRVKPEWALLFVTWWVGGISRAASPGNRWSGWLLVPAFGLFVLSNLLAPLASAGLGIVVGVLFAMSFKSLPEFAHSVGLNSIRKISNNSYAVYAIHHPILMLVYSCMFVGAVHADARFFLYVLVATAIVWISSVATNVLIDKARRVKFRISISEGGR